MCLLVAELLHHFEGKAVLSIDDPDKQEPVALDLIERYIQDLPIIQSVISNGDTSGGVGRGELPWGINGDDIEESPTALHLLLTQLIEIELSHVH